MSPRKAHPRRSAAKDREFEELLQQAVQFFKKRRRGLVSATSKGQRKRVSAA